MELRGAATILLSHLLYPPFRAQLAAVQNRARINITYFLFCPTLVSIQNFLSSDWLGSYSVFVVASLGAAEGQNLLTIWYEKRNTDSCNKI